MKKCPEILHWKFQIVCHFPKVPQLTIVEQLGPVSLVHLFSKDLEKLLTHKLMYMKELIICTHYINQATIVNKAGLLNLIVNIRRTLYKNIAVVSLWTILKRLMLDHELMCVNLFLLGVPCKQTTEGASWPVHLRAVLSSSRVYICTYKYMLMIPSCCIIWIPLNLQWGPEC